MAEKKETLNAETPEEEVKDDGSSPSEEQASFRKYGDLVSTVELEPPKADASEETLKTEVAEEEAKKPDEKVEITSAVEEVPEEFHKHPDWQRILKERNDARAALQVAEGKIQVFESIRPETPKPSVAAEKDEELPFKDISEMSEEDLEDWWEKDKLGLMANLAQQVAYETEQRISASLDQKTAADRADQTFQKFGEQNPDFWPLWADGRGKIAQFMQTNPGHNAISAYYELKKEDTQKEVDAKIAAAKVEGEKAALDKLKVKGSIPNLLGSGPSHSGPVVTPADPRMKDPKKFGGDTAVIAQRLKERRERGEV